MKRTFKGYRREDNKCGIRNLVAVIPSVICANDVAQAVCRQVPGTIGLFHHQGCCQLPIDLQRVTDTLINLGKNPNIGASLIVSLGCEGADANRIYETLLQTGKPAKIIRIQELGGTSRAIQAGIDAAQELRIRISGKQREECDLSDIVMAIKCGGSDATSGVASNVVIGELADEIVNAGGTVVFGETTEFIGGEHILARRAVGGEDGPVGRKICEIVKRMEDRAKAIGEDMRGGQPTPGNIAGGLSSIEEKSLGAIVKSGHMPVQGVLEYWESAERCKGLWIKDSPGREPEILTGMAAAGAQIMTFSTGRGAPQGFPCMPVIKICGNPNTYQHLSRDMDINAGLILTGEKSQDEVYHEVLDKFMAVLNGEETKNEALSYFGSVDIFCTGPVI